MQNRPDILVMKGCFHEKNANEKIGRYFFITLGQKTLYIKMYI